MRSNTRAVGPKLKTHEGAPAKRIGAEVQLRRTVMSCLLFEDSFYEDGQEIADRIRDGVAVTRLENVAAIAIEAREVMHLRHVPLLVVREMARQGGRIVGDTLGRVIQRPDELMEFLAIYWGGQHDRKAAKEPLSAQVKRGLAIAFRKFSAYQLAKYNQTDRAIKLRDVLFLVNPTPTNEEQAGVWKQLVDGTLESPDTWEVALSSGEAKKSTKDKRAHWTRLLEERKLGGLALLRNLRNMQEAGVGAGLIREAIADNSFKRVLPFRFVSAAKYAPTFEPELEQAMFRMTAEMPKLPGKTVLLIDHSKSMDNVVSAKSEVTRREAATALAMLLREIAEQVAIYTFSSDCRMVPPRRGFALRDAIFAHVVPQSTLLGRAKHYIDAREPDQARIIVITDEQSQDSPNAPLAKGYVVNVDVARNGVGYGAWTHIDGWSEGVLRYIQAAEGLGLAPPEELP